MAKELLQKFEFGFPVRIVFGNNAISETGRIASAFGPEKILLVTSGSSMKRLGYVDALLESIRAVNGKTGVVVFDGVSGEPSLETCDAAAAFARKEKADLVVGLGGGSVLDTAKTAAILATNKGSAIDHVEKDFAKKGLPFMAVPTTAGSGSEVTRAAVFKDPTSHEKLALRSNRMFPAVAVVDPLLTVSCPPSVTAESGMDVLTHAIEAFVSGGASPVTDLFALESVRLANVSLETAFSDGKNLEARERMALASVLAGMAISNAGTGACHAFAHSIGGKFSMTHGLINAVMLPHVMALNLPAQKEKFAMLAGALGKKSAEEGVSRIAKISRNVGTDARLSASGISERNFDIILDDAMKGMLKRRNVRPISRQDLRGILEKTL